MTTQLTEVGPRENPFPQEKIDRIVGVVRALVPGVREGDVRAVFAKPDTLYECLLTNEVPGGEDPKEFSAKLTAAFEAAGLEGVSAIASYQRLWPDGSDTKGSIEGPFKGINLIVKNFTWA